MENNEVTERRTANVVENVQAGDTLEMLAHVARPMPGERTLKVKLPPIFVILPPMSLAEN